MPLLVDACLPKGTLPWEPIVAAPQNGARVYRFQAPDTSSAPAASSAEPPFVAPADDAFGANTGVVEPAAYRAQRTPKDLIVAKREAQRLVRQAQRPRGGPH